LVTADAVTFLVISAKRSQDTALRDILLLVERDILVRNPQGGEAPAMHSTRI
jgi:hypothetical protein